MNEFNSGGGGGANKISSCARVSSGSYEFPMSRALYENLDFTRRPRNVYDVVPVSRAREQARRVRQKAAR